MSGQLRSFSFAGEWWKITCALRIMNKAWNDEAFGLGNGVTDHLMHFPFREAAMVGSILVSCSFDAHERASTTLCVYTPLSECIERLQPTPSETLLFELFPAD